MSRRKTPYVIFDATPDVLYVRANASGIHQLILLMGEVPLTFETDKNGKPKGEVFLKAKEVEEWHRKEHRESKGASGNLKIADALKIAIEKNAAEYAAEMAGKQ